MRGGWEGTRQASLDRCNAILHELLTALPTPSPPRVLDVGCRDGANTRQWAEALRVPVRACVGVDINDEFLASAAIPVMKADVDREALPLEDATFGVAIVNQVLEHLKNVHLVLAEVNRVLVPGGFAVIGLPNLASAHNRLLLLLGRQPTSIRVQSEHVRGFTWRATVELLEMFGFEAVAGRGAGFYPFRQRRVMAVLDGMLPRCAVYQLHVVRKAGEVHDEARQAFEFRDTNYVALPSAEGDRR